MSDEPIRVLVVDDHEIVRQGIRQVLESGSDFLVVAEAGDGARAVAEAETHLPDVVLLDVSLPGETGLDAARNLKRLLPATRILMLSVYDNTEYVLEAVRAGADGYLLKDSSPAELRQAIQQVHAGESAFRAATARQLNTALRQEAQRTGKEERLATLTGREREVLQQVVDGRTNKEAAALLGISHRTVETHRENILKKLGVRSVAELTRFAIEAGLLGDDDS
jgi:DNA-binding NarL/FixJ family response regulator